ncbi:ABC-2 type transport system permease protein/oleandomycin transport system permease protein [Asanoa ferruginea]|uniref:Transport permease protein n=1 Tax=Asanoa ferruginea TaxID=53367 RepID=A0A3D9ZAM7_9ACTN|nr:ABC transporter permease [Asanoa ferruginea]REF94317.1 ABC-2 type transport system permease protein/oleandomycin transport system permease protein [Asanoa ferruginea]GIF52317.1 transport permease protein [Asanoa ferruginea]
MTVRLAATQCLTLAWRGIVKIRRHPATLADVVFGPAIFLVLFVYVFGGAISGSTHDYLRFVLPGMLGLMTLLATMGVGVALNQDIEKGVFDRIRSLPTLRIAPLVGAIGGDIVRQVVAIVALLGFGVALGFRFGTGPLPVLAACALALGFALALSWVWVLLGLVLPNAQAVQGLGAVVIFPVAFASNIFVPTDTMPGWLRAFVEVNPVRHLMDALRGLLLGGPVAQPVLITLAWMAGFVAVFAPLALAAYRRRSVT